MSTPARKESVWLKYMQKTFKISNSWHFNTYSFGQVRGTFTKDIGLGWSDNCCWDLNVNKNSTCREAFQPTKTLEFRGEDFLIRRVHERKQPRDIRNISNKHQNGIVCGEEFTYPYIIDGCRSGTLARQTLATMCVPHHHVQSSNERLTIRWWILCYDLTFFDTEKLTREQSLTGIPKNMEHNLLSIHE